MCHPSINTLLDQFIRLTLKPEESLQLMSPRAATLEETLGMFQKIPCSLIDFIFPFHYEAPEGRSFLHMPR